MIGILKRLKLGRRTASAPESGWPKGLTIEEAHLCRQRGLEVQAQCPEFAHFATSIADFFKSQGATNYLEVTMYPEDCEALTITIQKQGGETPASKVARLEKRIAELTANEPL